MKFQTIATFLFFLCSVASFGKEIKSIAVNPVTKLSILPGESFPFFVTVTYNDGKSKKIKSNSSKFRNDFLTETEGCSFYAGELVINKLRSQIPENQSVIKVISKNDKNLIAQRTFEIAYFKKFTVKYERSYLNIGDKLNLLLEATTNTNEVFRLDKNTIEKKWSWFDISTTRGGIFEKGTLIVASDVRHMVCDTITFTVFPESADSLKQALHFIINYNKALVLSYDRENAEKGNDGKTYRSSGSDGGDGSDGVSGEDGKNILVYMTVHPCNKNLLKVEVQDTLDKTTNYYIVNKNGGDLKISCNGGNGGDGGDGANGEKGENAGKTSEPQVGGNGGNGADGGDGGDGGRVTIYATVQAIPYTGLIKVTNQEGHAGKAGKKGKGKSGGKGSINFADANEGADGVNGKNGNNGFLGGSPNIITEEVNLTW
jgi:hypothetical protein